MQRVIALAIVLCCTGCYTPMYNQAINAGRSPEYASGFDDGYVSGQVAAGNFYKKHVRDSDGGPRYDEGWMDGFNLGMGQFGTLSRDAGDYLEAKKATR